MIRLHSIECRWEDLCDNLVFLECLLVTVFHGLCDLALIFVVCEDSEAILSAGIRALAIWSSRVMNTKEKVNGVSC